MTVKVRQTKKSLIVSSNGRAPEAWGFGPNCTMQGGLVGEASIPLTSIEVLDENFFRWETSFGFKEGTGGELLGAIAERFDAPLGAKNMGIRKIP